ncbi:MAG TPA: phenylalanine--tRNA ligase subunit beta [Solirubrobacteraceae bacterium]|nr:phenylalanine--tRNA ligase subunit beta [Solirubrobacteraceae bacterium]
MRVPVNWLREYCDPPLEAGQLAERLAMTGTEVERVERYGVTALENFVVGRVLQTEQHPDADRLTVCVVDAGDGEPRQIVCGAPNVAAGQTVAVAKPGAVLPDGNKLKKVKLRGIESDGMILAEDELAIGTEHAGILELDGTGSPLKPGTPLAQVLEIATDVLVLEITPNRPDCLAIYGVARELHAATSAPLATPPWADDPGREGPVEGVTVTVEAPDLCPRFTARVFDDVKIGPSPPWIKARLMAAGQRPISNVVDITNYVMLLTGQPLHAFDLDRVKGHQLTVRRAHPGEQLQTLDGQTRTLDDQVVLIADAEGPTSIAGVMGGARSEVEPDTSRVLMEAATWDGPNIHRTSLKLGLRSEASTRFEKQLQPEQAMDAQAVATKLMIELCGATVRSGTIDIGGPGPEPLTIHVRDARVEGLLGIPVPREREREILSALEFEIAGAGDGLDVKPPPFRRLDITREADVIEEIARLGALDQLPATLPSRHGAYGRLTPRQRLRRRAADALAAQGLHEIVGWSFTGPELPDRLRLPEDHPLRPAVELENPLSIEQSRLRTTLLGSLLDAAGHNRARGTGRLRLFEAGAVFFPDPDGGLPREPQHLGALLTGAVRPPSWRDADPPQADFFAVKGVLEGLLDALRASWSVERASEPFLHPGRAARVLVDGQDAGWLGEIHPLVATQWGLDGTVAAFELDLDLVPEPATPLYEDVTSYPEVREDLAVVIPDEVSAARVIEVVRSSGAPLLRTAEVFDVYRDPERVGEGNVSLALRLSYRAPDRTLTDEEVAHQREQITRALAQELGGRVRAS